MKFIFKNNAISTIASTLPVGDTSIVLASGTGSLFPNPSVGNTRFAGTLVDVTTGLVREIVFCTARTGDTLTVQRAQEGTVQTEWPTGSIFAELMTAAQMTGFLQGDDLEGVGGSIPYDEVTGTNALTAVFDPPANVSTAGSQVKIKLIANNNAAVTLNGVAVHRRDGNGLTGGELRSGDVVMLTSDGAAWRLPGIAPANATQLSGGVDQHSAITPAQLAAAVATLAAGGQWGMVFSRPSVQNIAITAGAFASDDHSALMVGAAMTKFTNVAWAAGNNAGMMQTGLAVGVAGDFFIFAIKNPTSGAVDYMCSPSISAPSLPAGFTLQRMIGWFRRDATQILDFSTIETAGGGIAYQWRNPPLDVDILDLGAGRRFDVISVPVGLPVLATMNVAVKVKCGATADFTAIDVHSPSQADLDPSFTTAPLGNAGIHSDYDLSSGDQFVEQSWTSVQRQLRIWTDALGRIATRTNQVADVDLHYYRVATVGFELARR